MLEELKVPYETILHDFPELKQEAFEKLNPNGRTPAIEDPNTGIVLWESGAIIEYLIDTYDKSGTFTYSSSPEKYYLQQWYVARKRLVLSYNEVLTCSIRLHFQVSGQGPYFGQRAWFQNYRKSAPSTAFETPDADM